MFLPIPTQESLQRRQAALQEPLSPTAHTPPPGERRGSLSQTFLLTALRPQPQPFGCHGSPTTLAPLTPVLLFTAQV